MKEAVFEIRAQKMDQNSPGKIKIEVSHGAVDSTWATKCSPRRLKWRNP